MSWFAPLIDLALPRRCVGCAAAAGGAGLCSRCRPAGPLVRCGPGDLPTVAAAWYEGAVRAALLHYKERGRRDLAGVLGEQLARAVTGALAERAPPPARPGAAVRAGRAAGPGAVLVPVPSGRAVAAARGGDHVLRLARRAARRTGVPVATPLAHTRAVRDSAGLGSAERARNQAAAMVARAPGPAGCAVIVDDIVTTGATLREARRALAGAGWQVLGAATVAATARRSPAARPSVAQPGRGGPGADAA